MSLETPPPGPPTPPVPPQSPYDTAAYPPGPPAQAPFNVLSIVSLVSAFFISLVAVITGHIALSQIKRTGERGRPLAIVGLILGYLGILAGIVGIVILIVVFAVGGTAFVKAATDGTLPGFTGLPTDGSSTPAPLDGGTGGQTVAEACTILDENVSASVSSLGDNISSLQSDPQAAVTALQNLSSDFDTAMSKIDNPDVLEAAATANSDLGTFISDIQDYVADPSGGSSLLLDDITIIQTDFQDIGTLCGT